MDTVVQALTPIILPDELANKRQWLCSDPNESDPKIPDKLFAKTKNYPPDGAMTMVEALKIQEQQGKSIGFYATADDPYVLIDIDHLKNPIWPFRELPLALADLLKRNRTYSEISPSGEGLRVIYKLSNPEGKQEVRGKTFLILKDLLTPGRERKWAQIGFGPPWYRITQNITSYSVPRITPISIRELKTVFRIKDATPVQERIIVREDIDEFNVFKKKLMALPLNRNPRIQRAYETITNEGYQHYDFWIKILMSLHHYGKVTGASEVKIFSLADHWSSQDPTEYDGADVVEKHWDSFETSEDYSTVSYKTVIAIYNEYYLQWPVPKPQTKAQIEANIPASPIAAEYRNFEALLIHYGIHIHADTGNAYEYYLEIDYDIVDDFIIHNVSLYFNKYYGPYGMKELVIVFTRFAQAQGFIGVASAKIQEHLAIYILTTYHEIDLYRLYFETPFEELNPEFQENRDNFSKSTFDALFNCLILDPRSNHQREIKMYRRYYEAWWMSLLKNIFYEGKQRMASNVLLLTGPEQTYKTSHFLALLPQPFKKDIVTTTHGFGSPAEMRDTTKIAADHRILVWDEIEQFLNSETESNFKKILDGMPQSIIDKYEVRPRSFTPKAIYGATSNQSEFKLSAIGSRRIFHIPVKWVNTKKIEKLCWWPILQELKRRYDLVMKQGRLPWVLDDDELDYQAMLHTDLRSKSDLDIILSTVFQFDQKFDNLRGVTNFQTDPKNRLLALSKVRVLILRFHPHLQNIKLKALQNALTRACSAYTGTQRRTVEIDRPRCTIKQGVAKQGPHQRFVLPPLQLVSDSTKAIFNIYE